MKFIIVTGMSGAGKSTALKMLEDLGYFCVDNLPVPLISKFAALAFAPNSELNKVAVGIDVRTGLKQVEEGLRLLSEQGYSYDILFLEAEDNVLIKRFKETRRAHPLVADGRVEDGIREERMLLKFLKNNSSYIIDTSRLLTRELKAEIDNIFSKNKDYKNLFITVLSFGYKYGIPSDSDLVFDVRFLPNPYYIDELKNQTGNDKAVQDYVMGFEGAGQFLDKLVDMLFFLIPNYVIEGKNQLVISIGCTGGKHRSVTLANRLYERLSENGKYGIKIEHRDIDKDARRAG
ncbi:MAG: RNase adapter RapZ [Lachnospiraceae bacterium]|nr:RNase adapter RapZ [Lachnospiraceae bacterium]